MSFIWEPTARMALGLIWIITLAVKLRWNARSKNWVFYEIKSFIWMMRKSRRNEANSTLPSQ
ncbi:hypothetical protein D3C85_1446570 [compost metagenome]